MTLKRLKCPDLEPITLENLKSHLRIDGDEEDLHLFQMIQAARQFVEDYTGRSLLRQHWQLHLSTRAFFGPKILNILCSDREMKTIRIPRGPLIEIIDIKGVFASGYTKTMLPKDYSLSLEENTAQLSFKSHGTGSLEKIIIHYIAGYGDQRDAVPPLLRQAVLMKCADLYENRGDKKIENGPYDSITRLLWPYKEVAHESLAMAWR